MRTNDLTPPAVTGHVLPASSPMTRWPYQLRVALERLPQSAYVWDDDDPAVVWADTSTVPGASLSEPFDNLAVWVQTGTPSIVAGRTGTAVQCVGATNHVRYDFAGAGADYVTVGFAFRMTDTNQAALQRDLLRLNSDIGVTIHNRLIFQGTTLAFTRGSGILVQNTAVTLAANTWYYIEVQARLHDTSGSVTVRVNGTQVLAATNVDTRNAGTKAVYDQIQLTNAVGSTTNQWDDLYLKLGAGQSFAGDTPIGVETTSLVYDAPLIGAGFTDALCDLVALTVDPGEPDELGLFPATETTITLANARGQWSQWTADGRLVYWAPGRRVCIWAVSKADASSWWVFSGRVSSWTDTGDGQVTIVAHDGFAQLADDLPIPWTPGTAGQLPRARIQTIAAAYGYTGTVDGDVGDVTLTAGLIDGPPLEGCQRAALSDGGVFYGDADGRLTYRDRLWRAGRADQTLELVVSDNVCGGPLVVWDPEMVSDDESLYTSVQLVNEAGLSATSSLPADSTAWWYGTSHRLTHPDPDQWTTQAQGDALAARLLADTSIPRMAVRAFTMHLHAPDQDLWRAGIDLRRGDRIRLLHEFVDVNGDVGTLDIRVIAASIRHEITADTWSVTVTGTRTVDWTLVERWDETTNVWDLQPLPAQTNVWRY